MKRSQKNLVKSNFNFLNLHSLIDYEPSSSKDFTLKNCSQADLPTEITYLLIDSYIEQKKATWKVG